MKSVSFHQMKDGTAEEYRFLDGLERSYASALPGRILSALRRLETSLDGYLVSRLDHSLQAATRAERDGADPELIAGALVHDIGDDLAPWNHAALAAEILRPHVRPQVTWIIEQHGLFQSYYYAHHMGADRHGRESMRGHCWFTHCAAFCENWDQASFDPDYDSFSLDHFVPLVTDIFGKRRIES